MKKIIIAAIGAALLSGNAMADITWKDYRTAAEGRQSDKGATNGLLNVYIAGATSTLLAANVQLMLENKPLMYCQPDKLSLNPNNVRALLDNKKSPVVSNLKDDMPLGMAVFYALRDAFPCK